MAKPISGDDQKLASLTEVHQGPPFGELAVRAIRRYADRMAVSCEGKEITYLEMGEQISCLQQVMKDQGIGPGNAVCTLLPNRPETIFLRIAVHLLGARYTPLNPLGATEDHIFIIRDSEAEFLILESHYAPMAESIVAESKVRRILTLGAANVGVDMLELMRAKKPEPLVCGTNPQNIAAITYTGGTTGKPKGIIHSDQTLVTNVLMCLAEWDWPEQPRMLLSTPLSHAAGLLTMPVFVKGGSIHITDGFDAGKVIDQMEREHISATFLVPTMLYALTRHPRIRSADLANLKLIIYGAAPISPSLLVEGIDIFGKIFLELYAQSEAPMTVTTLNITDHDPALPSRLLSCGFPMVGVQVRLMDDNGIEVPVGEVGEICVRGPLVMEGYWKRPEDTAAAFKGGWLHTGDLARADDQGYLYIVDRKKDMIISGGFNVYPKEVEDILAAHPDVAQAVVFSVPDDKWGEAVKAVILPEPGHAPDIPEIIAYVRRIKGPVNTPKSIDIVKEMPLTALGKPDKQALRAPYWQGHTRNVS